MRLMRLYITGVIMLLGVLQIAEADDKPTSSREPKAQQAQPRKEQKTANERVGGAVQVLGCPAPTVFCPMIHEPHECKASRKKDQQWSLSVKGGNACLARSELLRLLCGKQVSPTEVKIDCKSLAL